MSSIYYIGLDVHKDSIAVVIAPSDSTEVRKYGVIITAQIHAPAQTEVL